MAADEQTITMQTTDEFDPAKHVRLLSGREYLDVKWRIVWFRRDHPTGLIVSEMIEHKPGEYAVFKTTVTAVIEGVEAGATGWGSETKADFHDYFEKAETKSVGRALQHLGYGTASLPDDGERIADTPVDRDGRQRDPNPPIDRPRPVAQPQGQTRPQGSYPMRNPNEPATPAQTDLIIKIAARKKIDADDLEAHAQSQYGRSLADLTKGNASALIELIKQDSFTGFLAPVDNAPAGPDASAGADPGDELADARF